MRVARAVLSTPPISPRDDGVIFFSMIGTRVLLPYLVSIKSLWHQLRCGRVVILDDGTLTASDKAILAQHLGSPKIIAISDVTTGECPVGGTWERLLTILDLRADAYVIQLDSDTVTVGPVPEIAEAIAARRDFTLRGEAGAEIRPLAAFSAAATGPSHYSNPRAHVQGAIESGMGELDLPELEAPAYVRGCSGFAGFAPNADGRSVAEAFSREARKLLGAERWAQWGSEQVTSNFIVANQADPLLLPYDRYMNFWDEGVPADARLIHFIGTHRYDGSAYSDATRRALQLLSA